MVDQAKILRPRILLVVAAVLLAGLALAASPTTRAAHAGDARGCAALNHNYDSGVNVARLALSKTTVRSFDTLSATVTLTSPAPRTPAGGVYVYNTYGQGAEFLSDACVFVPSGATQGTYKIHTRTSTGPATAVSYVSHTDGTYSRAEAKFVVTAR